MLSRKKSKAGVEVTFILPLTEYPGPVSVVGDFNNWEPYAHPLIPHDEETRAVRVTLDAGQRSSFRYLAHGGHWFDEQDADGHDGRNSFVIV
jgi:hypothetical protein